MRAATLATKKAEPLRAPLRSQWLDRARKAGIATAPLVARSMLQMVLPEASSALEAVRRCMRQLEERQSAFASPVVSPTRRSSGSTSKDKGDEL